MIDRVTATSRLALEPQLVSHHEPSWSFEILICGALSLALAGLYLLSTLPAFDKAATDSAAAADFWRHRAEAKAVVPEPIAVVRIVRQGEGFACSVHNIRREWELAVAAECQTLGQLLLYARTTP